MEASAEARASSLRAKLAGWKPAETLLVADLDGTLHRGRFAWARGLSNVDLAFEIGWLLRPLGLPIPPIRYSLRVAAFAWRERTLRRVHGDDRAYYAGAIEGFRESIAAPVRADVVARAAAKTPELAHLGLAEALGSLRSRFGGALILSKAFQPVVDAYATRLAEWLRVDADGYGNALAAGEPLRHAFGMDKARSLDAWLAERPGTRHVLVVGDTAQDLAMGEAAKERLGAENAAMVAVAPKSEAFAAAADAAFADWTSLAAALA